MINRRRALAWVLILSALGCYQTTTIVLVRHAERPPGTDPDLLPEGRQRAGDLARALERAHVSAIFHTQFKRTRQTAESLAARTGVAMTEVPFPGAGQESAHAADVARRISNFGGRTVVYVGHNSTVPAVIAALGITPAPGIIPDTVFNRFFIVTKRKGSTGLVEVRYGR
ncbi:MAG TPA: histidine phosphatase family protein [Gemmatimonadaceae bacterium]|jgi:broad specificity phosphatase PhoE|nr:histidine phosphatase family protein [Gemmatimonadaceae bacterium]